VLTTRVTAGRPTIAIQALDRQAGIDPYSLALNYGRVLVGEQQWRPRGPEVPGEVVGERAEIGRGELAARLVRAEPLDQSGSGHEEVHRKCFREALALDVLIVTRLRGANISDVLAPAQVVALHVVLGIALAVGMRLANSYLWSD
jgi:hypothetical protein